MGWRDRHSVVPAVYLIFRRSNEVLLARRCNTGYMDGMYNVPSGHLDGGETAEEAACREAKEEVGMDVTPAQLRLVHIMHRQAEEGDHERIDLFFEVHDWHGEPKNTEPDKCDELRWAALDDLPENVTATVRQALENSTAGTLFSTQGFGR